MDLSETATIKAEFQITFVMVKKINQDQKIPTESLRKKVESNRTGILSIPSLEQW